MVIAIRDYEKRRKTYNIYELKYIYSDKYLQLCKFNLFLFLRVRFNEPNVLKVKIVIDFS